MKDEMERGDGQPIEGPPGNAKRYPTWGVNGIFRRCMIFSGQGPVWIAQRSDQRLLENSQTPGDGQQATTMNPKTAITSRRSVSAGLDLCHVGVSLIPLGAEKGGGRKGA